MLLILERFGPMGRKHLGEALNLTEGVVRGLITKLQRTGRIEVHPDGCRISTIGEECLQAELARMDVGSIIEFPGESLGIGTFVVSAHVRKASHKVRLGVEQRDISVRIGADGAVTLTYEEGKLRIPGVAGNLNDYAPEAARVVFSKFKLRDGDSVLLVFAHDFFRALEGALLTARALYEECSKG